MHSTSHNTTMVHPESNGNCKGPLPLTWFDFLLSPDRLQKHLSSKSPEPSATDLIIQFLTNSVPIQPAPNGQNPNFPPVVNLSESGDSIEPTAPRETLKSRALKLLALKVAAHLSWDLDELSKLPLPMQRGLFCEFLRESGITSNASSIDVSSKEHLDIDFSTVQDVSYFAINLYYRWCLYAFIKERNIPQKAPRVSTVVIPGQVDPTMVPPQVLESISNMLQDTVLDAVSILGKQLAIDRDIKMPILTSFAKLNESSKSGVEPAHEWNKGIPLMSAEIQFQTRYELGSYHFFLQNYTDANEEFSRAFRLSTVVKNSPLCKFDETRLQSLTTVCSHLVGDPSTTELDPKTADLNELLRLSVNDNYKDLLSILERDNAIREISLSFRNSLRLDIQRAAGGKDKSDKLAFQVFTLNSVRSILDGVAILNLNDYAISLRAQGREGCKFLQTAVCNVLPKAPEESKQGFRLFLIQLFYWGVKELSVAIDQKKLLRSLFTEDELTRLTVPPVNECEQQICALNQADQAAVDAEASEDGDSSVVAEGSKLLGTKQLTIKRLETRLMTTFDPAKVRVVLRRLLKLSPRLSVWSINKTWEVGNPMKSLLLSLPPGYLQQYMCVMIAKSKELTQLKRFDESIASLQVAEKEIRDISAKLCRMLRWEIIENQLGQCQLVTPAEGQVDHADLTKRCRICVLSFLQDKETRPSAELAERCAAYLLNTGEWEQLGSIDVYGGSGSGPVTFIWTVCTACAEVKGQQNMKSIAGSRVKPAKSLWEMVTHIFAVNVTNQQVKRSAAGAANAQQREPQSAVMPRGAFNNIICLIKDACALSLLISLLAKLHNIVKDDVTNVISIDYASLWPSVLNNLSTFNLGFIQESLQNCVEHALSLSPLNTAWLKVQADFNYVLERYALTLRCFLELGAVASDGFVQPVPKTAYDNATIKKMINSCAQLQCYSQAMVLCQFTDEMDYALAFKYAAERTVCNDAMDSYYEYIWDITLLEFIIANHQKRNEIDKKKRGLAVIGQLELNANNNEEIKREASNSRKTKFLRAMFRLYDLNNATSLII